MTRDEQQLERLTFFSDAVFAIAITLLVIEIHVPNLAGRASSHEALQALADLLSSFIGFFVSFAVIGSFWANHHRAFGLVEHYDHGFVWPNLLLLVLIAFLPFSTAFMSLNFGQRVPHLFYLGSLLAAGLAQRYLLGKVLDPRYAAADVEPVRLVTLRRRMWALPIGALAAMAMAFYIPALSTAVLIVIWPLSRLLGRTPRAA